MERMLAADDPRLAARLAAFGQPGVSQVLHTRRARAVLSLLTLTVIGCVAAVIYMVNSFQQSGAQLVPQNSHSSRPANAQSASHAPRSLSSARATRGSGPVHCVALVTPHQCTLWKPGAAPARQPAPATDQPAKAGSRP
jgi:hypothetical protein